MRPVPDPSLPGQIEKLSLVFHVEETIFSRNHNLTPTLIYGTHEFLNQNVHKVISLDSLIPSP